MPGRNTAPFGVANNTKQNIRPDITLQKVFLNYSDSLCALARTNGRSHSFVLDLFFVILSDYLFPSREKEERSEWIRQFIILFCSFGLNQKIQKSIRLGFRKSSSHGSCFIVRAYNSLDPVPTNPFPANIVTIRG